MHNVKRLLIVARVPHYRQGGRLYAYGPYAQEVELWADLFPEVQVAGSLLDEPPPGDCRPFARDNISVLPVRNAGGQGFRARLGYLLALPTIVSPLCRYMRQADAIHVRCPCDLGLVGSFLAPLFSRRLYAKYATQWLDYSGEPWTWRLSKRILGSRWWRGPVTVYGQWPNQPANVVPFFTSLLTEQHLARARQSRREVRPGGLRVLFVGRLTRSKNAHILLSAIAQAQTPSCPIICTIVGEGPERGALEQQAAQLGLTGQVRFTGGLGYEQVLDHYEQVDVLVLASDIEGWPKVITEGMAFGLLCIGSARGMIPQFLGEGRGIVVPPQDVPALANALRWAADNPSERTAMAARAATWAQRYSLEGLREALRELLTNWWKPAGPVLPTSAPRTIGVMQMCDTLETGGLERVAVNVANHLPINRCRSHLCTTRREGLLAETIQPHVGRLSLGRTRRFEWGAVRRLVAYIRKHDIQILHAHGTAVFLAMIASWFKPYPLVIWHDHFGRQDTEQRPTWLHRLVARRLSGVISVSTTLAAWSRNSLRLPVDRVWYIQNFVCTPPPDITVPELPGQAGARIVCVANFRPQKDHPNLLRAMRHVLQKAPDAHLLLLGNHGSPGYEAEIQRELAADGLTSHVSLLGCRNDVAAVLKGCDVGVLSSSSEGLPLALIEYGMAGLASVATRVGQCADVLDAGRVGLLVPPHAPELLAEAILTLLQSSPRRTAFGQQLRERVHRVYSERPVMQQICAIYETVLVGSMPKAVQPAPALGKEALSQPKKPAAVTSS